jgi:phospho-N-acetylmuramoyl-pentapeptide-transferase
LLLALFGTRFFISWLVKRGYGQFIRDDGPQTHQIKRGTPTMGGIVIIISAIVGYVAAHLLTQAEFSYTGLLVLGLVVCLGLVGFTDDYIKIIRERSLGLHAKVKLALQTLIAIAFGVLALLFPDERGLTPASQFVSFLRDLNWAYLGPVLSVIFIVLIIASWSNAANLTDGLDGLATGAAAMVFLAYAIINIWQYNQSCAMGGAGPRCYEVRDPHDMAILALALAGACFGFLWWNASPAKIFMGDTGSLALGGAIAGLSIVTRTELLMMIVAGLFLIITLSVVLQIGWFKATKGKRLFKMAPLQHHFELLGWKEITIVVRFWIICGLFVIVGVGLFYAEWVVGQ